jgi:hypothetical protein
MFGECPKCGVQTCKDILLDNTVCDDCYPSLQKKRKCRTCGFFFESGNKLFKHLRENISHYKDIIPEIRYNINGKPYYYYVDKKYGDIGYIE